MESKQKSVCYSIYYTWKQLVIFPYYFWVGFFFFVSKGFKHLISLKYTCSYIDVNQTIYLNVVYKRMENS